MLRAHGAALVVQLTFAKAPAVVPVEDNHRVVGFAKPIEGVKHSSDLRVH
jgi:hypothetical protein